MFEESTSEETIEIKSFQETLQPQLDEFCEMQQQVIAALDGGLADVARKSLSSETSPFPEILNYGKPPFLVIVDDGDPLLLLDDEYQCHPLRPFFELDDECMSDDHSMIYSTPISGNGLGILRFVPANPDYDYPFTDEGGVQQIDTELFGTCDEAYEKFIMNVQVLSKEKIARHLFRIQEDHKQITLDLVERFGEFGLDYGDFLRMAVSSSPMMQVFNLQTIASSQRIIELMEMESEDDEEEASE